MGARKKNLPKAKQAISVDTDKTGKFENIQVECSVSGCHIWTSVTQDCASGQATCGGLPFYCGFCAAKQINLLLERLEQLEKVSQHDGISQISDKPTETLTEPQIVVTNVSTPCFISKSTTQNPEDLPSLTDFTEQLLASEPPCTILKPGSTRVWSRNQRRLRPSQLLLEKTNIMDRGPSITCCPTSPTSHTRTSSSRYEAKSPTAVPLQNTSSDNLPAPISSDEPVVPHPTSPIPFIPVPMSNHNTISKSITISKRSDIVEAIPSKVISIDPLASPNLDLLNITTITKNPITSQLPRDNYTSSTPLNDSGRHRINFDRSRCLLIANLRESDSLNNFQRIHHDVDSVKRVLSLVSSTWQNLEVDIRVVNVFRLGKRNTGDRPRLIKIVFDKAEVCTALLKNSFALKGSGLRLFPDLPPEDRLRLREAQNELQRRREEGENRLMIQNFQVVRRRTITRFRVFTCGHVSGTTLRDLAAAPSLSHTPLQ